MTKNVNRSSIKGLDDYEKQVNDRREFEEFRSSITNCDFSKKDDQNVVCEEQNEENPNIGEEITDNDIKILQSTLKSLQEKVMILENSWNQTQKEFKITESQIKQVYQFNEQNRDPMPDYLTEEEQDNFDHFNGIDKLTDEKITEIFGEAIPENPIVCIDKSQTIDRIKQAVADFFYWLSALRQYNQADIAYMQLMETKEEQYMINLKLSINKPDVSDENKEAAKKAIENYFYYKLLKFLAEPLSEKDIKKLVEVYGDEKKIDYWIQRSRDKLKQKGFNPKIILEISKFEINYLEDKYHCISNALLLRFIHICTFADMSNPNDNSDRTKIISLVMSLDGVIRNIIKGENKDIIMNNIRAYLDQIIDPLKEAYPVEVGEYYKRKNNV